MVKAVFLDWFNTLAHYEPRREELQVQALQEFGIKASPDKILQGVLIADQDFFEENIRLPVRKRSTEEQSRVYTRHQSTVLSEAGVNVPQELMPRFMKRLQELYKGTTFALFEDVLPALKILKECKFILGLLTNLDKDMNPVCQELGLEPYLDFVVTSREAGADKPEPPIFLAALNRAGIAASEALHVGDQYKIDVLGAKGVGITALLIDRYDFYPGVSDCYRIHTLAELPEYLEAPHN